MKDFTYTKEQLDQVAHLGERRPCRIWCDYVSYVFEYDDYYIRIKTVPKNADTQNEYDEAIVGEISRIEEKYKPRDGDELVVENAEITSVYVVRTLLYFTTYKKVSRILRFWRKFRIQLMKTLGKSVDPLYEIIKTSIGGNEEVICHPQSEEANSIRSSFSNLIDTGVLLEIGDKFLRAHVQCNGFGFFASADGSYLISREKRKEDAPLYEYIKV